MPLPRTSAAGYARARVEHASEDPAARLALVTQTYRGPYGRAPDHLPFRRSALAFMRWQADRGVLGPLDGERPGSAWWRALNDRLLRDGSEAVARSGGLAGRPSSETIALWTTFVSRPTAGNWYRAHNASIVAGYLENRELAEAESEVERFFLNVVLLRVLYAHALVAAPRLALGRLGPLGRVVGDPRLGAAGGFLALGRVLPDDYPVAGGIDIYLAAEHRLARLLDYGVIGPRLQALYEWSARELGKPGLSDLIEAGSPVYAWPIAERWVWTQASPSVAARLLGRITSPR